VSKFIILFLLFSFSNLFAQSNVRIKGNVKSSESQNLIGANVSFEINKKQLHAITDTLGNFSQSIPGGNLVIKIDHLNFTPKTIYCNLQKDTILSIVLEKDISLLKEVIISND
jgi:hypothetical protein